SAITKTELKVAFNKAIDAATVVNFKIPGLNVESASLDATKKVVTLKVSGAEARKSYELTATGLKVDGTTIADMKKTFEMPNATDLFKLNVKTADAVLKADGASKTLVTFELKDAAGNAVTAGDIEVEFTTTFGSLAANRVTVQNGVATVLLTSEFSATDVNASIIAQIKEAADKDLIGLKAESTLKMSPNPDDVVIGEKPVISSAESNQADRVVVYFNKDVQLNHFIDEKGILKDGIQFKVYENVPNSGDITGLNPLNVKGLLKVPGNNKALTLVLDQQGNFPMADNANVFVTLTDSTNGVSQESKAPLFKLTDARQPSMLNVQVQDLRTLKVTFSEALDKTSTQTFSNWSIDGVKLNSTDYSIEVGEFVPNGQGGDDTRHVVTIKKKKGYFGAGPHSIQAAKIGDWAAPSDKSNYANTQTLDFNVVADENVPVATVDVQSPEQWLIDFNVAIEEDEVTAKQNIQLQVYNESTKAWEALSDAEMADLHVTKVEDDKFLVETKKDWTKHHNTSSSLKNYFNYKYQLSLTANAFTNAANGKKNVKQDLLLGDEMLTPDTVSAQIKDITEVVNGKEFKATLNKPVKLMNADEGKTLAEKQVDLPEPKAEFIKADNSVTIPAVVKGYADKYDTELTVVPVDKDGKEISLESGEWTLVIRSISDDIGNTVASMTKKFKVIGGTPVEQAFQVEWAFADVDHDLVVEDVDATDNDQDNDYIFVKFTSAFAVTGDFKNALKQSNYTIDNRQLPIGSQIIANIEGYNDGTEAVDSLTIQLPNGWLGDKNAPHVLNVSKYLEGTTGTKISGDLDLKLAYKIKDGQLVSVPAEKALAAINSGTYTAADLTTAGVTGVDATKFADYKAAIDAAKATKGSNLTLAEVQAEVTKVNTPAVDKTALTTAITEADKLVETDYTAGWTEFQTALTAAKAVQGKADATKVEVDKAVADLDTATKALVKKPAAVDKTALDTAVSNANTAKAGVKVSVDGTDVPAAEQWVTQAVQTA
ncbi:Ig-like domain-containing protein, partial [Brevibacillus sp. NPDC058079]|uniref:Ig-like domain-containing protein n=1 Tax=Brevibacillus sp. NPDC058079 TaxID=3346330 RepID=UPI0036F001DA